MSRLRAVLRVALQATQDQGFEVRANRSANSDAGRHGLFLHPLPADLGDRFPVKDALSGQEVVAHGAY